MTKLKRCLLIVGLFLLLPGAAWPAQGQSPEEGWQTYTTAGGLADNDVRAIDVDGEGQLWFGTHGHEVSVLDDGGTPFDKGDDTWTTFTESDGLAGNWAGAIAADGGGRLWFGTGDEVSVLDHGGTPCSTVRSLATNAENLLHSLESPVTRQCFSAPARWIQASATSGCTLSRAIIRLPNFVLWR